MRKSVVTALCVVMASLLLCLGAVWYFFGFAQKEPETIIEEPEGEDVLTFADGAIVDGLDISGMTLEAAASALNKLHVAQDEDFRLELFFEGFSDAIEYPDITVAYNTTEILNEAIQFGNTGTTMRREEERARVKAGEARYTSVKAYSIDDIGALLTDIAERAYIEPLDATARFDLSAPGRFAYTEGMPGRAADIAALELELRYRMETESFGEPVEIPITILEPLVAIDQLAVKNTMISTYSTSYEGRSLRGENRVYNINRFAEAINGQSVMPGETFDLNAAIGPRTEAEGWKEASASPDGQAGSAAGAGATQGASTLYNAALMADLEVTEREASGWPLDYVPIGREASIAEDGFNLCFRNESGSPVYIVAYCDSEAKTITCEIWGEPLADGVTIKIDSKKTGSLTRLSTIVQIDTSLGAGKRRTERENRTGSTAESYKEYYDRDGNLIERELLASSTYPSIQGLVYVSAVPAESQTDSMPLNTPIIFPSAMG